MSIKQTLLATPLGRVVRRAWHGIIAANELRRLRRGLSGVWLDVGAHLGETTRKLAIVNPRLTVYAFEPSPETAAKLRALAPKNYHVIEKAVSETDGPVTFYLNNADQTHSLMPLNADGVAQYAALTTIEATGRQEVQSIRLDTFLRETGIPRVDYLKIDTQGADLAVVKSAGAMLPNISKIRLEVNTCPEPVYTGECRKPEILEFMDDAGFVLIETINEFGLWEDLTFERHGNAPSRGMAATHGNSKPQLMNFYRRIRVILHPVRVAWLRFVDSWTHPAPRTKQRHVRQTAKTYNLDVLIETGTYRGDMVAASLPHFRKIVSVELEPTLAKRAQERFRDVPTVTILEGDSKDLLPQIVAELTQPALFWLDGHYSAGDTALGEMGTPIRDELRVTLMHPHDHVLMIDDARLFNGTEDYPTLAELKAQIAQLGRGHHVSVRYDIIYVIPPSLAAARNGGGSGRRR